LVIFGEVNGCSVQKVNGLFSPSDFSYCDPSIYLFCKYRGKNLVVNDIKFYFQGDSIIL
jgi:hypothetical protein